MEQVDVGRRILEARVTRGLSQTQLAQALGVDRTVLSRVEKGERRVTALELLDLARELGRRVEWFLTPPEPAVVQHRGTDPEELATVRAIDVELETLAADVRLLRDLGHLQLSERPRVFARPESSAEAEELGRSIRSLAGISDGPVHDLVGLGERLGLLAFSVDLGQNEADAASMVQDRHGIALINSSFGVGRRRLALAHELAHVMVDDQYQTDFRVDAAAEASRHEAQMDRAARAVLLPEETLRAAWQQASRYELRGAVVRLGSEFRVGMSTLAKRLWELGLVDAAEAAVIREVHTRRSDIVELNLYVPHDLEGISLPPAFAKGVIHAYAAEDITIERALGLMRGSFEADDFAPRPVLSPESLWSVVW